MENTLETAEKRKRIYLLDEIRGFAVICMVFHHTLLSIGEIFSSQTFLGLFNTLCIFQPLFWFFFFGASGISSRLSRNNLSRGLKLLGIALVVTVVTWAYFNGTYTIVFGVLHFLSLAMIIFHFIKPLFERLNPIVGIVICFLLFAFTYHLSSGYVGIFDMVKIYLPRELYGTHFLFWLGFPSADFVSADYFPLLPHIFLFFIGGFLGTYVVRGRVPKFAYKKHSGFLCFFGKHALIVYIAHQPIIYAVCYLVKWILNI